MKITIAQRSHPFSHQMGTKFLLPNTSWSVQVFPTRLFFSNLEMSIEPLFFTFDFTGPIDDFTAELDLEKGCLNVFGKTQKGYMRYQLFVIPRSGYKEEGIWLHLEKAPEEKVVCHSSLAAGTLIVNKGDQICLIKQDSELKVTQERLSLGMHKAQDWDLVRRRLDLKEIFPQWFLMASYVPQTKIRSSDVGNYSLLKICSEKIQQREKEGILQAFENVFLAAFEGVLVPRVWDLDYQGIIAQTDVSNDSISPLPLLTQSGELIRSLFFQENLDHIQLLPCLPAEFHCGRMVGIRDSNNTVFDFEWTKKTLRSVCIYPVADRQMSLKLPKGIRSFRLRKEKSVANVEVDFNGIATLSLQENKIVHLGRFEY